MRLARVVVFAVGIGGSAQVQIQRLPVLPVMREPSVDLDPVRHRVVAFGGPAAETYEFDGAHWWRMQPTQSPGPRFAHGVAFDPTSGRMLLFGGIDAGNLDDTWAWDGSTWTQLAPLHHPAGRYFVRMATDYARQRIVLHGGYDNQSNVYGDTWEWDGSDWTQVLASGPGPRMTHAMAYDPVRHVVVLFGGRATDLGPSLSDTWEWDGSTWQQRAPIASPSARSGAAMTFDPGRSALVLFGGRTGFETYGADTWQYDGSTWSPVATTEAPLPRQAAAACVDPTLRPLIVGGGRGAFSTGDAWRLDASTWSLAPGSPPPARRGAGLGYDGQRLVMVGGRFLGTYEALDDVWTFDGESWSPAVTTPRPPALYPNFANARVTVVWQSHRQSLLAVIPRRTASETWEWDGSSWTQRSSTFAPFGFDYPLAYDEGRQRAVCVTSIIGLSTTWEWDGNAWSSRGPAPQGTWGQALAYDPTLQRVVLVGGGDPDGTTYGATYAWNGGTWQPITGAAVSSRSSAGLVFDGARQRLVLIGGGRGGLFTAFDDAYELVGGAWQQRLAGSAWTGVADTAATYDPRARVVTVLGTSSDPCSVWQYGPVAPADFAAYGVGCDTHGLTLTAIDLPWGGDAFSLALSALPPNAPALIALGTSRTSYLGLPLPFDLTAIGMTQCRLLASPDVTLPVANLGGTATLTLSVPPLPGALFYAQGFGVDPAANRLGIAASNAGAGMVGSR